MDSLADTALFLVAPVGLAFLLPAVMRRYFALLLPTIGLYVITQIVCRARFRRGGSFHTWLAKAAGALVGVVFVALLWVGEAVGVVLWLMYAAVALATLAHLEQLAVALTLYRWDADVPSFWHARFFASTSKGNATTLGNGNPWDRAGRLSGHQ